MVWSHGKRHSKQIAEQLTFNVGDIIQRDFRPVCEHHPALKPIYLFEVSTLCHIRSAGLLCIRDEVGYGQSGMVVKSFHEDLLLPRICQQFGVSKTAAVIRLKQLGHLETRPYSEYNDPLEVWA